MFSAGVNETLLDAGGIFMWSIFGWCFLSWHNYQTGLHVGGFSFNLSARM